MSSIIEIVAMDTRPVRERSCLYKAMPELVFSYNTFFPSLPDYIKERKTQKNKEKQNNLLTPEKLI